ncbi:MAG TPA: RagB/SusD family nutrient uptake outer membrane protein [Puia sp.]|nr:RagB/SusD family nutrient uptake outer membrane protein [Puia sp.]
MKKLFLIFLLGSVVISGCNKILTQQPTSQLDATTAFTTGPAITAGLLGCYNAFQNQFYYGDDYTLLCDLEADGLLHTGSYPTWEQVNNRAITPDNTDVQDVWNQIYAGINRVNTIIASAPSITTGGFDSVPALGEARFLRAFMYFDLMRFWGGTPSGYTDPNGEGVPLVLTPTYTAADATPHPRATAGEVFSQILSDVNYAVANAPASNELGRATSLTALAFKARVELYIGMYDSAAADAEQVMGALGPITNPYPAVFAAKNVTPESIFELQFSATNQNGLYFYYFGRDEVATSQSLENAYQPQDARLPINFYTAPDASGNDVNATQKYDDPDGSQDISLIRLAEMYLTDAEGIMRGSSQNMTAALADINAVRARSGETLDVTNSPSQLLTDILNENRLEFPAEAHRWFDLRRLGLPVTLFAMPDSTKVLWPIPQYETLTSGGVITQNPGY